MIKEAKIKDFNIISEIIKNSKSSVTETELDELRRDLTSYNKILFIDYENNIPVAFAKCFLENEEELHPIGHLEDICIKRTYQNKGIDKRLLVKCEDWAKKKDCIKFTALCNINDANKLELYTYAGFSEIEKIAYFSKNL